MYGPFVIDRVKAIVAGSFVLLLTGACTAGGTSETAASADSPRVVDACDHFRSAMETYSASPAAESDFLDLVTALGYTVQGVQGSGDSSLESAAAMIERDVDPVDYGALADDSLPALMAACADY